MSIALTHDEVRLREKLACRINQIVANFQKIIIVDRNLGFFTFGYNHMIKLIPALFIAPIVMGGEAEFGILSQAALAFATIVNSLSFFINKYMTFAALATATSRLSELSEAAKAGSQVAKHLEQDDSNDGLSYESITIEGNAVPAQMLLREFNATIPPKGSVVIVGSTDKAREAMLTLFHATAGLRSLSHGKIRSPLPLRVAFLPDQPHVSSLDLYDLLAPDPEKAVAEIKKILPLVRDLGITLSRSSDAEFDGDQWLAQDNRRNRYLLAVVRILLGAPRFVLINHLNPVLGVDEFDRILKMFEDHQIAPVIFGEAPLFHRGETLEILGDGSWKRVEAAEGNSRGSWESR
jgi:putative ATP-binding cassette transporter